MKETIVYIDNNHNVRDHQVCGGMDGIPQPLLRNSAFKPTNVEISEKEYFPLKMDLCISHQCVSDTGW